MRRRERAVRGALLRMLYDAIRDGDRVEVEILRARLVAMDIERALGRRVGGAAN